MTSAYIFDTDVCSFVYKGDSRAESYREHLTDSLVALSFQTIAELYQWTEVRQWGELRRTQLDEWLSQFVIIEYDDQIARLWAKIRADRRKMGKPISAQDAWVASCAIRWDCQLITHNRSDYVEIENLHIVE